MLTLAIETTGPKASVAICGADGVIFEKRSDEEMNHLRGLTLMIESVIKENGFTCEDIRFVAASEGPGSFTGIRIGVATARALAQAWGAEAVGVPTLASFVHNLPGYSGIVCPVFDARRSQVYCGAYRLAEKSPRAGMSPVGAAADAARAQPGRSAKFEAHPSCAYGEVETLAPGAARSIEELMDILEDQAICRNGVEIMFFGDGLGICMEPLAEWANRPCNKLTARFAPEESRHQQASSVIKMALPMIAKGLAQQYHELKPVYLRKAEAERKLEERMQSKNRP